MRTNTGTNWQAFVMGSSPGAPANYIGLANTNPAPVATDTVLPGEITAAGGGLVRAQAAYAYTSSGTSTGYYTLTKTFTANATDGASNTIYRIGVFNAAAAGILVFESAVPNPPTLIPGDSVAITHTITI